jgi:CPA2 family monovalent cation:H+ antiporter-2
MNEVNISLVFNLLIFLLFPFIFGVIFKKIKLSPLVGYILGGLLLGNLNNQFINNDQINNFAYFGIVLLLFAIGLEINFNRLLSFKKIIVVAGTLQLLLSAFFSMIVALIFNFSLLQSFLIGIALSSSSTSLVAKIIEERGEENSFLGEIALGILMFQDFAFIPYMIIFNSLTFGNFSFFNFVFHLLKSLIFSSLIIAVLWYLGNKITPKVFDKVAKLSRELLNLFIVVFIFFISLICLWLKIPILVGAFIAGILVAQSLEHYHVFSQIRPLRDILAVVFFVYIGLNIKILSVIEFLPSIFLFTFLIILVKALIVIFIFLFMRFHSKISLSLALFLFQIDEDAFILASIAYLNRIFSYQQYLFIITSVLISLIITPFLINKRDDIYKMIRIFAKKYLPFIENFIKYRIDSNISPIDILPLKNHVVLCGYGRIGRLIGQSLLLANIPFLAIDYDLRTVSKGQKEGVNIIYGDPTDFDILDYAQIDEAVALIIAIPYLKDQEKVIINARKLNPNIYIIARVHNEENKKRIKSLGVQATIQPEFEAALSIIKRIYFMWQIPKEEIRNKVQQLQINYGLV